MHKFEILCVTMHQNDFSKIKEMNIHSDVVFANQADATSYVETEFEGHTAKMITTATRGVGINRNLTLSYASGDICLFADDDVRYGDALEETVMAEFDAHLDADIIIFNLDTDNADRKQVRYEKTRKCGRFERMPWGSVRIAFRLSSIKKANIWFTTLFGGGCIFPSGEDSMWLANAKKAGLIFYVSKETIGKVSFNESTWFSGYDEKYFYGKGAWCCAMHPKTFEFWKLYYLWRYRKVGNLTIKKKIHWMNNGKLGYKSMINYNSFVEEMNSL